MCRRIPNFNAPMVKTTTKKYEVINKINKKVIKIRLGE